MCTWKPGPGKFEGETCITRLGYEMVMQGSGVECDADHAENCQIVTLPITPVEIETMQLEAPCLECAKVLAAEGAELHSREDTQGFVFGELVAVGHTNAF